MKENSKTIELLREAIDMLREVTGDQRFVYDCHELADEAEEHLNTNKGP
jgi:hypothetical protein